MIRELLDGLLDAAAGPRHVVVSMVEFTDLPTLGVLTTYQCRCGGLFTRDGIERHLHFRFEE